MKKSLPVESKKLIYQFYSNFSMAKGDPSDYLEQCLQTDEAKDAGIDRHSFKVLAYPVFSQNQQPERFDDAAKN
ncbi:hypothetical protein JCM19236_6328 [Vibrio sp. JCM 19236]|nr:hypothetical protein JCM19236_6328 [Vibrio sp. JCM 19236]